jgi:N,N-dimethylformamidase
MDSTQPLTPTVIGYVDALTARPGEEVVVRVSVLDPSRKYRAGLVRLLCGDARPKGPAPREAAIPTAIDDEHEGIEQYTDAGSYAIVENLPHLAGRISLEVLAWPSLPGGGKQTLLSLGSIRLVIDERGCIALVIGEDMLSTGTALRARWWHRVSASYDPATGAAEIRGEPFAGFHTDRSAVASRVLQAGIAARGPLLFAARQVTPPRTTEHFEGKLEAPKLTAGDLELRWDFGRGIGTRRVDDISPHGLHGLTVSAPKRAVTGSLWDGTVHDWKSDPTHYRAIHFHSDDLYDAGWSESLRFTLPDDLKSGFYAVKLQASGPPFYVGFVVSPKRGAEKAKLAVLASTMTYLAYANYRRRMSPGPFELTMARCRPST